MQSKLDKTYLATHEEATPIIKEIIGNSVAKKNNVDPTIKEVQETITNNTNHQPLGFMIFSLLL